MKADAWQAFFSGGTFVVAAAATLIGLIQLNRYTFEMKQEGRPYIVVDYLFRDQMVYISVRNIGKSPATNVRIKFDPELTSSIEDKGDMAKEWLSRPLPFMAPGRKLSWILDSQFGAFKKPEENIHNYRVNVTYSSLNLRRSKLGKLTRKPETYVDPEQILDINQYVGTSPEDHEVSKKP